MSEASPQARTFTVPETDAGTRLDLFLVQHCPDLSRNQIQNALGADRVEVNGRPRPKGYRLAAGHRIRFQPLPRVVMRAEPQAVPLRIVHQDDDIIVVDKQAGLVVHPAPGHADGTLVNALLHHCGHLDGGDDPLRPGIVHRLDRDTTGLLVVALNEIAHRRLAAQLKQRTMTRIYLALSWGSWPADEGALRDRLARHPRHRHKRGVVPTGGREAETRYRVIEDFGFVQLCEVSLLTGRTHQIRVQFAHASHPVVGDPLYGDDRRARNVRPIERGLAARMLKLVGRQMLHAAELRLVHPVSESSLSFSAPPPEDLAGVLSTLRGE